MIQDCYCGSINESNKLLKTSSGGASTILAEQFIKNGGLVVGVQWSKDYKCCFFTLVRTVLDIERITGTKYIYPKYKIEVDDTELDLFPTIQKLLNENNKILFFGLGCNVGALLAYLKQKKTNVDNLYTVDILCHGPALDEVHLKYIDELEKKAKSKLIKLNHRYKKELWMPKYIKADFENGLSVIEKFNDTTFGIAFHQFARPQCSTCQYKGNQHKGDLCFGDYWGANPETVGYNKRGTSLIFVQSQKGYELLNILKMASDFELFNADYNFAIKHNPMYVKPRQSKGDLKRFKNLLEQKTLKKALRIINFRKNLKSTIVKPALFIKNIFKKG